jgi:LacI family transcriptional regulator
MIARIWVIVYEYSRMSEPGIPTRRASSRSHATATIKDVAAAAKVSTATVSRVMAGFDGVTRRARERVMRAVAKLDYHPNRLARHLRAGRSRIIGVIIPDLQNPFFPGVVHGVEQVLYTAGYMLMLGHSDGLAEREQRHMAALRVGSVPPLNDLR